MEHRLTKLAHSWTNGQVKRMNCTIKEDTAQSHPYQTKVAGVQPEHGGHATAQRYSYQTADQLHEHLQAFLLAYNHAKRLKTLRGLTPHEFVCA